MTLLVQADSVTQSRKLVAKALIKYTVDNKTGRRHLAQQDIAMLAGTNWDMVHASLKSLQNEGAIKIERHRIIINKDLLQKAAGISGYSKAAHSEMA